MTQFDLVTYFSVVFWFLVCFIGIYLFFLLVLLPNLYKSILVRKLRLLLFWIRFCYSEKRLCFIFFSLKWFFCGVVPSRVYLMFLGGMYYEFLSNVILYLKVVVEFCWLNNSLVVLKLLWCFSYAYFRGWFFGLLKGRGYIGFCILGCLLPSPFDPSDFDPSDMWLIYILCSGPQVVVIVIILCYTMAVIGIINDYLLEEPRYVEIRWIMIGLVVLSSLLMVLEVICA